MTGSFFEQPILNSPYGYPDRHWQLDAEGQPTGEIREKRRRAEFITPIPKPKKRKKGQLEQKDIVFDEGAGVSAESQLYDPTPVINELRVHVDRWRAIPNSSEWNVTPETQRLLQHWRHHEFSHIRPFFCQVEAVETLIWLTEVAPKHREGRKFLEHLDNANENANPGLPRVALKLATGAGKTTVMAMTIAWQTINAVRHPNAKRFTRGFLVVTPGITIRDRLRVLQPNDPDSYYESRELIPRDMLPDLLKAKIVIANYHAFKHRETMEISKGGRALLQGRTGEEIETLETDGQMLKRVMGDLLGMKGVMVLNDEAHHCYREKPEAEDEEGALKGDEAKEAKENTEAARLWISGLEAANDRVGLSRIVDLSATPFFLKGSGYAEGTLFPWTMSNFGLMDAIECGIVKLPRVPVAENVRTESDALIYRHLWENIRKEMPKKGRGRGGELDPEELPTKLKTALDVLYNHYRQTFELWKKEGLDVPPCFIIVCNNTAASKLVYDYVAGYELEDDEGTRTMRAKLDLFSNYDEYGNPYARPNTLLIDSAQLESGDALDRKFRKMAEPEIELFKRQMLQRGASPQEVENISDQDLLREVMNTVGKQGRLGEYVRCVVSVAMLTEGWDANNVTHVLGVRAFGTQLLCEQVIGRALRRQSYDVNDDGLFEVEYADILGIPFDFTAKPVVAPPQKPRDVIHVHAVSPERDDCEIVFPRVTGYRVELPKERLKAEFNEESTYVLTPDMVGPTKVRNEGLIGEGVDLSLEDIDKARYSSIVFQLTSHVMKKKWRDREDPPGFHLFNQLKPLVRQWLDAYLEVRGEVTMGQILYRKFADEAAERITTAITREHEGENAIQALLDPYNPAGSTRHVHFNTSKELRWQTDPRKCHVNWAILDSDWEGELCRVLESHPQVHSYVKNHALGFEVPYRFEGESRTYRPDFIVRIDDGRGPDDLLHLVIEIKGYRGENAKAKKSTMLDYWIPGVNQLGTYGRWSFIELTDIWDIDSGVRDKIEQQLDEMIGEKANA